MNFPQTVARVPSTPPEEPAWKPHSGEGRQLTAEEKAALLASRPDLAQPAPAQPRRRR